jgi:NADPH2:quinone reductase
VARVKEITGGKGVKVVYDSVGKDTFMKSLDCLRPFGLLANFGNASGKVPPLDIGLLAAKGSLYVSGRRCSPTSPRARPRRRWPMTCSRWSASGKVQIPIDQRFPLADSGRGAPCAGGAQDHRLHHFN